MKMKKVFGLMLTLFVLASVSVNAQVTIGSQDEPHPAAVLDLKSTTTPGKGLLLPNVEITSLSTFGFSGDASKAAGMIVYCPGANVTQGVYVWNGSKWTLLVATATTRSAVLAEDEQEENQTEN